MNQQSAISRISKCGVLLVFPVNNQKEPRSLWAEFFPRRKLRWEWDDSGDNKVADMWTLMKRLSDCRQVVYSKWYQGRATFFSRDVFRAMLNIHFRQGSLDRPLTMTAQSILETLEMDSPLSTKELKRATDLQGRLNEPQYTRATKELFSRLMIVAYGEVDDGAFPSLAVGATKTLYEDLWTEAQELSQTEALACVERAMPKGSKLRKFFDKTITVRGEDKECELTIS